MALSWQISLSQCGTIINTFPYNENFESSNGGWINGGVNDDWAWGIPSKAYITSAASGLRCWVTGGLTGSTYNFAERSYVVSPCFDFTTVLNPHVKVKVYWESENVYDGATFQYTTNNGVTWNNVGSNSDPINCLNQNWFNQSNINALTTLANPKSGWAGTVLPSSGSCNGGGGSLGWVLAQHCMPYLAGQSNVQFRFAFGAGTLCNDYDGFAFDEITIGEAPANSANFSFACTSNSLEYQFTNSSTLCPDSYSWNFGDPSSGVNNTSSSMSPTHTFSSAGTYNVSLTVSGPCNVPSTIIKTVTTLASTVSLTNPTCSGTSNGAINVIGSNGSGVITYGLQPSGITNTSGTFNGLSGSNYTVTVSDAAGCSITTNANLLTPNLVVISSILPTNITCFGLQNGSLQASANGGTGSINYTILPSGSVNSSGLFQNLSNANYTVVATDANGCSVSSSITITMPQTISFSSILNSNVSCNGQNDGQIQIAASGGTGNLNFNLMPGNITNTTGIFTGLGANTYSVTVSDANGCTLMTQVTINEPALLQIVSINITEPQCSPNNSGAISINASGGNGTLEYSIGGAFSTSNSFNSMTSSTYTVVVKDASNCSASSTVILQNPEAPQIVGVNISPIRCYGEKSDKVQIVATSTNSINLYELSPGAFSNSSGVFLNIAAGNYTVTVIDSKQCSATSIFSVTEPDQLIFSSVEYTNDSCGFQFTGTFNCNVVGGTPSYQYVLLPGNIQSSNGILSVPGFGNFTITVADQNGCESSQNVFVAEKTCCEGVFVPNAFSPNFDGLNDELRIINTAGIVLKEFSIFNRWGNIVFTTTNTEFGWNGNYKGVMSEIGTYYYFLKYQCVSTKKEYLLKGDFLLLR